MAGVSASSRLLDAQELMRLVLARYRLRECAALLNVTYHTVCRRARQPEFLEELRAMNKEAWTDVDQELRVANGMISSRICELSSAAIDKLEAIMMDENADRRQVIKVAQDFLDRNAEASKTTKQVVEHEHAFMDPRVLAQAAKAAKELDESSFGPLLEADTA